MNIEDVIFTSYCFGDQYLEQQVRLAKSIRAIYPQANLHFRNEPEETGKPKFQESLYGFKVHMIRECIQMGYTKIIFFDTAICLEDKVDYWFELCKNYGFLAAFDRQSLADVTSDNALNHFELSRDEVRPFNLCGGSLYILDLNVPVCQEIWTSWAFMEYQGLFGKQDDLSHDRLQGHRMDESCLGLCFMMHDMKPLSHDEIRYAYEHPETKEIRGSGNPIVIKRHFK